MVTLSIMSLAIPALLYKNDRWIDKHGKAKEYESILEWLQMIVNICDFLTLMVLIYLSHSFGPYLQVARMKKVQKRFLKELQ